MPRAHVEARKGTIQQAIEYCQKEGDWEEHGEKPKMPKEKGEGEKKRWRRIFEKAEEGDEDWLKGERAQCRVQAHGYFPAVTRRLRKNRSTTLILRMNGGSVQPELASQEGMGRVPNSLC